MENKSNSGVWKFFAILFGVLLAGVGAYYIYKQRNPEYDPWEEPWKNSSSPVNLDDNDSDDSDDSQSDKD